MKHLVFSFRPSEKDGTDWDMQSVRRWCHINRVPVNRLFGVVVKELAKQLQGAEHQTAYPIILQVKLPGKIVSGGNHGREDGSP